MQGEVHPCRSDTGLYPRDAPSGPLYGTSTFSQFDRWEDKSTRAQEHKSTRAQEHKSTRAQEHKSAEQHALAMVETLADGRRNH